MGIAPPGPLHTMATHIPEAPPTPPLAWLRVRHAGAVLTLGAAPLAGVAWSVLVPLFTGSMATEVAGIAAAPGRFLLGTYLGVLMSFLMVAAALVLGRLLRPRAPVAGDLAAACCALGACFHGGVLVFQLAELAVIAGTPDRALATTVVTRLFEHTAFLLVLAPFLAFYVGLVGFAVLLLVRRAAPRWVPVLLLIAVPIELAGPMPWKARLFFALLLAAFLGLAHAVWRLGAAAWAERDGRPVKPSPAQPDLAARPTAPLQVWA